MKTELKQAVDLDETIEAFETGYIANPAVAADRKRDKYLAWLKEHSRSHATLKARCEALEKALDESLALNINWAATAEPHELEHFSEYKAVIQMAKAALGKDQ